MRDAAERPVAAVFDDALRAWVVTRCPHCGRTHRHRVKKVPSDPREQLGWVKTPCGRGYTLIEASGRQIPMPGVASDESSSD